MEEFLILALALAVVILIARDRSRARELRQIRREMGALSGIVHRIEKQSQEVEDAPQSQREISGPVLEPTVAAVPSQQARPSFEKGVSPTPHRESPAPAPRPDLKETPIPALAVPGKSAPSPHAVTLPEHPPSGAGSLQAAPDRHVPAAPPRSVEIAPTQPARKIPVFDWEGLIGVKLFSWIAGVALVVAAVFFLNYSIDRGWLQPPVQLTIGILAGLSLLALCELKAARKYRITANAMDGSAIAILFATFYAAYGLWHLVSPAVSFVFMVGVAVVAVLLSIRRDSLFIALLGLMGGFATPALVSSGENQPITLFSYLLLLNVGLAWVAAQKKWPLLATLSLIITTLYQWSWVMSFLTESQLPLALGIFLVFPVMTYAATTLGSGQRAEAGWAALYGKNVETSAVLPMFFAVYLAAVSGYGTHYGILFGFLFLLSAGLFAIALARGQELLHLSGAISTLVVFAVWLGNSYRSDAWPAVLAFLALFVVFYLAAPMIASRLGRGFQWPGKRAVFAAPLLLSTFSVLAVIEPAAAAPGLAFSTLFLLLAATTAFALITQQRAVYLLAALLTLAAEAAWSAQYLTAEHLGAGLVMYAVFGLLYIGVPVAGIVWSRGRAVATRESFWGSGIFLGIAGHILLLAVASGKSLAVPPWPWLAVLFLLDLAAAVAVLCTKRCELFSAALAVSALILMVWVAVAATAPWPGVAVVSAGALVGISFAWIALAKRAGIPTTPFDRTAAMALFLAQIVTIVAAEQPDAPEVGYLILAHLVFLGALLCLAWISSEHILMVIAVAPAACAVSLWIVRHAEARFWHSQLLFAAMIYMVFLAYPLALGRRAGRSLAPYLGAVLASAAFFFQARHAILAAGRNDVIGILPVVQALLMGVLLLRLQRIEPPGGRAPGRLALVAGAALGFVTVAIPLQLERQWITISWALEGAALAWLYRKIPHRGLLYATSGLLITVFFRLAVNVTRLSQEPGSVLALWNWYLYAYLVSAAAMMLAGWLLSGTKDVLIAGLPRASSLLPAGGAVLLFLLLNIEIADYFSPGDHITFNLSATLAQDLTYTLGWALFGVALLAVGIAISSRAARASSLGLLVITILKCFLHDLARLGGLYRVISFVGLAVCLALVALALQKFVMAVRKPTG